MPHQPFLQPQFWDWVDAHLHDDPVRLRLSMPKNADIDVNAAILQIESRKRFGKKLSETLREFPRFYFPDLLSGEQSTSDLLAAYHASFFEPGDTVVDMTAGLGIDIRHIASKVDKITAIERKEKLCDALRYNLGGLNINNVTVVEGDSRELIKELHGDVVFVDPARRSADGSRVFGMKDSEPDVIELLPMLRSNFKRAIIKASPMIDISLTLNEMPGITDVYVLGTKTECKELDFIVDFNKEEINSVKIHAVTILTPDEISEFVFTREQENETPANKTTSRPVAGDNIYVPYPSTMKAAPVRLLSDMFGLNKFHNNTHLYFAPPSQEAKNFPGEALSIVDVIPWQSKNLKRFKTQYPNVSVTTRNFGMTAEELRKKLQVKEGGSERLRLFGVGLGNNHTDRLLIVAS
ncbi:MAG: hypothetical protein J1F20_03120 [Muribaculaceae bacterium]|nr:hypothetical protein [Muribaculaceae bacterium]